MVIVVLSSKCYGQLETGISFGLNYNSLDSDEDFGSWKNGVGFNVSGLLEKSFNKISVMTKPGYSFNNMKRTLFDTKDNLSLHYLSLPIILTYKPLEFLKVAVGPEFKLLLHQNELNIKSTFDNDDFKRVDYGVRVELFFTLSKAVDLSIGSYLVFNTITNLNLEV